MDIINIGNESALTRLWRPFCSFLWLQIYQEDMMRSLLQSSLHVFRAISGTATDLGWLNFFQFVTSDSPSLSTLDDCKQALISVSENVASFVLFFFFFLLQTPGLTVNQLQADHRV